jgi:tRNA (adenine57-N1/adenine58-N1)-methyltransferase
VSVAQPDDLVLLVSFDHKRFIVRLAPGDALHTHRGIVSHDDVIGRHPGARVLSHLGCKFTVLRPSWDELLMTLPRATQIVYPKDVGLILLKLAVVPGARVVEAGSGSGILTTALARYVTPGGHVYSYEARADMIQKAQANVRRAGLEQAVTFRQRSIEAGFDEDDADALFLDVREPWLYLRQAAQALSEGGFFGAIVPTVNQIVDLVGALYGQPFVDVEIIELLERHYKALPERVRPLDRLTAHTGFLVFARRLAAP